jgi:hypothetical protein
VLGVRESSFATSGKPIGQAGSGAIANRKLAEHDDRKLQAVESKPGFVRHLEKSLSIASGGGEKTRGPSQNLPSAAIYCHFVAAKLLRSFQLLHFISCPRRACRPAWAQAENRERGREEPRRDAVTECRFVP